MVVSASAVEKAVILPSSQEMVEAWVEAGVEAEAWAAAWVVEGVWAPVTLWRLGLLPSEAGPWRQSRRAQRLEVARTTMPTMPPVVRQLLALFYVSFPPLQVEHAAKAHRNF